MTYIWDFIFHLNNFNKVLWDLRKSFNNIYSIIIIIVFLHTKVTKLFDQYQITVVRHISHQSHNSTNDFFHSALSYRTNGPINFGRTGSRRFALQTQPRPLTAERNRRSERKKFRSRHRSDYLNRAIEFDSRDGRLMAGYAQEEDRSLSRAHGYTKRRWGRVRKLKFTSCRKSCRLGFHAQAVVATRSATTTTEMTTFDCVEDAHACTQTVYADIKHTQCLFLVCARQPNTLQAYLTINSDRINIVSLARNFISFAINLLNDVNNVKKIRYFFVRNSFFVFTRFVNIIIVYFLK